VRAEDTAGHLIVPTPEAPAAVNVLPAVPFDAAPTAIDAAPATPIDIVPTTGDAFASASIGAASTAVDAAPAAPIDVAPTAVDAAPTAPADTPVEQKKVSLRKRVRSPSPAKPKVGTSHHSRPKRRKREGNVQQRFDPGAFWQK
jgi:hypothetical protein